MNDVADQNTGGRRSVDFKIVFTCSFLLGLLFLVALRTNGWRLSLPSWISLSAKSGPAGPEETIYGMLDAARAGDTNAYLDMFSETMRDQLLQGMKENVNSNFAAYLKSQNAAFQGVAVSVTGRPSDNEAWSMSTAIAMRCRLSTCGRIRAGASSKWLGRNKS